MNSAGEGFGWIESLQPLSPPWNWFETHELRYRYSCKFRVTFAMQSPWTDIFTQKYSQTTVQFRE